jgi:predicted RNA-binding Zn-ribbon protein involved in translation (DUF1610 family)
MSEAHSTVQTEDPIERHPCPRCGWNMMPTRVVPDERNEQKRTFECTRCGNETVLRAI